MLKDSFKIYELCFCLFSLIYSRACIIHMVKNKVLLIGSPPKSRNFCKFGHFFPCFVIRKFFNAINVKNLTCNSYHFLHALYCSIFFIAKVLFSDSFYRQRLLNYNYYTSLLGTTLVKSSAVAKKQKKVYCDWWSKPVSVYLWIPCFRHEKKRRKMRRKGMILSQKRYFHPVFEGFAPWNSHQGSALDPLGAHNAPKPQLQKALKLFFVPHFNFQKLASVHKHTYITYIHTYTHIHIGTYIYIQTYKHM